MICFDIFYYKYLTYVVGLLYLDQPMTQLTTTSPPLLTALSMNSVVRWKYLSNNNIVIIIIIIIVICIIIVITIIMPSASA